MILFHYLSLMEKGDINVAMTFEGRYQCSPDVLKKLQDDDSVALRYSDNPNGSIHDIAGITNKKGNVLFWG